jgi:hypothetical protein
MDAPASAVTALVVRDLDFGRKSIVSSVGKPFAG